jgi:hypothetical protein
MKLVTHSILTFALGAFVLLGVSGCRKQVNVDKTLECAQNQPYKSDDDCKKCCGGDFKVKDEVCMCYK